MWDDEEEARTIGEDIEALHKAGQRLDDMAHPGAGLVPDARLRGSLRHARACPTASIGGPRFYERQEIKDAIAYLEVTLNPANDLKFERIVNVPKRGLGDTAVRRVNELAAGARRVRSIRPPARSSRPRS